MRITHVKRPYEIHINEKGSLIGKNIIVTGGSGVIGRAICFRLAAEGANVYVGGSRKERVDQVVNEIVTAQFHAFPLVFDLLDNQSLESAITSVNHLDGIVCCAGGGAREKMKSFVEQDIDVFKNIIEINLVGTMLCAQAAARQMIEHGGGGALIFISSTVGTNGLPRYGEYAAAKGGIIAFSKSIAMELGEKKIRVNCISPGIVERNAIDEERMDHLKETNWLNDYGKPEDIANATFFLLSPESSFITGQNIKVDGGRSLSMKGI